MIVACYARKSNDKKNDSIENQLSIIRSYICRQKDLQEAEILQFSDDGYSGIDVNRDAFQDLLAKVRQRKIDVIAVKDFSSLGRNYLDVCKLTDSVFPFMGVRLIAVSENYDSKYRQHSTMDLPMAFKAVLDEYYVTESSEKVRRSCRMRVRSGEFVSKVPYGYFLSDRYTPSIDEEKAVVVREIFTLYISGHSALDIARILNQRSIPTSSGVKWTSGAVRLILKNESYIGRRVSLTCTRNLKTKRCIPNDESEWFVDEDAFPPMIEREVFDEVQRLFPKQTGRDTSDRHIMARKLYCAGCGRTLGRQNHFYCKNAYVTGEKACFQGSLKRDVLYAAVLKKVKRYIRSALPDKKSDFSFSDIAGMEAFIAELKEKKAEIFEEYFHGKITEKEFRSRNEAVSSEIAAKQDALHECRRIAALSMKYGTGERPADTLRRLYEADELTKEHMQFVKRINVFDAERFDIILQEDSPLAVLCRNMSIYEEM